MFKLHSRLNTSDNRDSAKRPLYLFNRQQLLHYFLGYFIFESIIIRLILLNYD